MSLDKIQIVFQSREPSSQRAGTLTDRATEAPIVSFPQKKKKKKKKRREKKKGKNLWKTRKLIRRRPVTEKKGRPRFALVTMLNAQ